VTIAQSDRQAREVLRTARQKEQAAVNRKKWIEPERSPDDVREENVRLFGERVLGWTPVRLDGADYPFSQENVRKLLLDPAYGRVYNQLAQHFAADDSFTKRSAQG
jgi:hypothetical protein